MIDPMNPSNFNRSRASLEEFVLFGTLVAGKPARRMALLLETMLANARFVYGDPLSPFEIIRIWIKNDCLGQVLRRYAVGQYTRIERCWRELVEIQGLPELKWDSNRVAIYNQRVDLRSVTALEKIHGIGPKTARFIVLHSVAGARCIPVDTHWIKELREKGYPIHTTVTDGKLVVPMNDAAHARYEQFALAEVEKSGQTCAEYDLAVWLKWNAATQRKAA